ncbi:MAG: alpha/beta hydrolase [Thermomicrobiales bacterium]|nr:alpha/beta hydrolase [Thermomicrobiales bacterium]
MIATASTSGYAPVNNLQMYYEIHGSGEPLVVIHGAFMTIEGFGALLPALAANRQVIAVELQGHGRTADIDRPLSFAAMADDVAALSRHLGIDRTDVFGYSLGGGVALQIAIRHPELVRKLIVAAAPFKTSGIYPEVAAGMKSISPEMFAGTPMETAYRQTAPNPEQWPRLIEKIKELDRNALDWPEEDIHGIVASTMVVVGDADIVRPSHAVEMFELLGGGIPGDFGVMPRAQLAVLPGTGHIGVIERGDWLIPMVEAFLAAPMPEAP